MADWGRWNNDLDLESHPGAQKALYALGSVALEFLLKGRRDTPQRFSRFVARKHRGRKK